MAEDMDFESFDNLDDLDWSELEKDLQETKQEAPPEGAPAEGATAAPDSAQAAQETAGIGGDLGTNIEIGYLLDVNLQVTVEVGKKESFISHILTWDRGSIIELDKSVGQPLNLLINNKPVAKGEVVVVNEKFALKITEIMDPKDRLNYLNT